ncbi:hypothetical protein, partial [Pseudoflavonifractor phocaeensis]|uniref:hypothetical protein n=1 Tax=Pseudoflavonifractor phocaeensis TaxID=1870988 RepID=UPI00195C614D
MQIKAAISQMAALLYLSMSSAILRLLSSIVQTLNLRGVKNPEKVDAVGLQPTASIPFLQYGGDTQI